MNERIDFGYLLFEARRKREEQRENACKIRSKLNVTLAEMTKWESGISLPHHSQLSLISRVLRIEETKLIAAFEAAVNTKEIKTFKRKDFGKGSKGIAKKVEDMFTGTSFFGVLGGHRTPSRIEYD